MKIEDDTLYFESGKTYYAHRGIIGIDSNGNMYGGYDQEIFDTNLCRDFTKEEKKELCEYMIELWKKKKKDAIKG